MRIAYDIEWLVDEGEFDEYDLPDEIEIPDDITDIEEISDYISDEACFLHLGFKVREA